MTAFRCRAIAPTECAWDAVEATTPEDAVQTYHDRFDCFGVKFTICPEDFPGREREDVNFMRVEVEGLGSWVSRLFCSGLYRRGGVRPGKPGPERLADVAKRLGWKGDPLDLIATGWDGEEPY